MAARPTAEYNAIKVDVITADTMNVTQNIHQPALASQSKRLHMCPSPHPKFTGRKSKLEEIQVAIESCKGRTAWSERVIVIHGVGGMGKTEIAKVIAHECKKNFDYVKWFNVEKEDSTKAGFKSFAKSLQVNFDSKYDCPEVYRQLAEKYNSGIFIFDNVEGLETSDNVFGIYDFLPVEYECEHPIIIMTSRHGKFSGTGNNACNFKMINIESLDDNESYECLVNYLGIKTQEIPTELEESIHNLAFNVQGYPLALALIGSLIAKTIDSASFAGIAGKIRDYIRLLNVRSFVELSEESQLEEKLKIIFKWTMDKIRAETHWKVAQDILNILAAMNVDTASIGFVNGIYYNKYYDDRCPISSDKFQFDDLSLNFRSGLKLLTTYSVVTLSKKYSFRQGDTTVDDLINIHRLIKENVVHELKCDSESGSSIIAKILDYYSSLELLDIRFDRFENLFEKIRCSQTFNAAQAIFIHSHLIAVEVFFGRKGNPMARFDFLRGKQLNNDHSTMLKLSQYCYNCSKKIPNVDISVLEIENGILSLTPCFTENFWVIRCCVIFLNIIDTNLLRKKSKLCKWVKQCWKYCKGSDRPHVDVMGLVWRLGRLAQLDTDFIMSVFQLSEAGVRSQLWEFLKEIFKYEHYRQFFSVVNVRVFSQTLHLSIPDVDAEFNPVGCYEYKFLLKKGIRSPRFRKQLCNGNFCTDLASTIDDLLQTSIRTESDTSNLAHKAFEMMQIMFKLTRTNEHPELYTVCPCFKSIKRKLLQSWGNWLKWLKLYPVSTNVLNCFVYAVVEAEKFQKLCLRSAVNITRWKDVVSEFFYILDCHLINCFRDLLTNEDTPYMKQFKLKIVTEKFQYASYISRQFTKRWATFPHLIDVSLDLTAKIAEDKLQLETAVYMFLFWFNLFSRHPKLPGKVEGKLKPMFEKMFTQLKNGDVRDLVKKSRRTNTIQMFLRRNTAVNYASEMAKTLSNL